MKKYLPFLLFLVVGILVTVFIIFSPNKTNKTPTVTIKSHSFTVELATNPMQWEQGLAYRDSISMDHGMLFLFPDKQYRYFWMRGMRFPLDIIWVDDNTIIGMETNVPVPTETNPGVTTSYKSTIPINRVLELSAGSVELYSLKIGEKIKY